MDDNFPNNQATPIHLVMQDSVDEKQYEFIPTSFDDYIGQNQLKEKLKVYTTACKMRNDPLDHMLLLDLQDLAKQRCVKTDFFKNSFGIL